MFIAYEQLCKWLGETGELIALVSFGVTDEFPRKRIIVNLAPASVRKEGPAYDLPIALGVLVMMGRLPQAACEESLVVGELYSRIELGRR